MKVFSSCNQIPNVHSAQVLSLPNITVTGDPSMQLATLSHSFHPKIITGERCGNAKSNICLP